MKFIINALCCLIPFPAVRRPMRNKLQQRWNEHKDNPEIILRGLTGRPIILWVDHALGGGTEVYSEQQFKILQKKFDVLRLQYFPKTEPTFNEPFINEYKILFSLVKIFK